MLADDARLEELGYKAHPFEPSREEQVEAEEMRFLIRCLAVAGFAAIVAAWLGLPVLLLVWLASRVRAL